MYLHGNIKTRIIIRIEPMSPASRSADRKNLKEGKILTSVAPKL